MKKYVRKKEEGVSPVIATILMVAITVVLAATLYLMLPKTGPGDSIPKVGLAPQISKDGTNVTVTVSNIAGGEVFLSTLGAKIINKDGSVVTTNITLHNADGNIVTDWPGSSVTGSLKGGMYFTFAFSQDYDRFQIYNNKGILGECPIE